MTLTINSLIHTEGRRIKYSNLLHITNLDCLAHGSGARFLLCIEGKDTLIAKQWKRKEPAKIMTNEVLVEFN